jgi:hypothetical protein
MAMHPTVLRVIHHVKANATCDVPNVVLRARERAGKDARSASFSMSVEASPPHTVSSVVPTRMARAVMAAVSEVIGYYLYLAVHSIPDRKKNSFIAVARDPVRAVYEYNHGRESMLYSTGSATPRAAAGTRRTAMQKEAHLAAPYLALASVIGPVFSKDGASAAASAWATRIRGTKSKFARGHAIAAWCGATYYGADVPMTPAQLATHLDDEVAQGTGDLFKRMRRALLFGKPTPSAIDHPAPEKENAPAPPRVFTADDLFCSTLFDGALDRALFTTLRTPAIVFCV